MSNTRYHSLPDAGKHGKWQGGSLPTGLFHPAVVDVAAQDTLLQALDASLDAEAQASCTGPSPDGRLTSDMLGESLESFP